MVIYHKTLVQTWYLFITKRLRWQKTVWVNIGVAMEKGTFLINTIVSLLNLLLTFCQTKNHPTQALISNGLWQHGSEKILIMVLSQNKKHLRGILVTTSVFIYLWLWLFRRYNINKDTRIMRNLHKIIEIYRFFAKTLSLILLTTWALFSEDINLQ